ncbi:MAG TPA: GAF domain-containing protein [Cytophagaceae bacterium]|jgi:PAS domain-containing protein|nr:GAF domain-containing protein [Cytophagaceae bacterium]
MALFSWNNSKKIAVLENEIEKLTHYLKISEFSIKKISNGNFELNKDENAHPLQNSLLELNKKMKEFVETEKQRSWISEGLVTFVEIFRRDQTQKKELYHHILASLIKYVKANQGGLFILSGSDKEAVLEMVACYAYEKKKFIEKKVAIGEGLLGQCFMEQETSMYTDLPPFYTTITSGLGEVTPGCLLLVPLKFNNQVIGVLEIAGFHKFQKHEIDFIEKIAESIASISLNIQNTEKARNLLLESEQRAQMLKEQEEELRQNLEELVATQEEMQRKQKELDQNSSMMKLIIDNIPFPVFVKNEIGRYTLVNKAEASLFNLSEEIILGKDDSHFVENEQEWKVIQESDLRTLDADIPVELPEQSFTTSGGVNHIFKTTKIPFVNSFTGKKNILGVSVDLTEKMDLEKKLRKKKMVFETTILITIIDRQRMLSQKIGFYSEILIRGKRQHSESLKKAIDLYDHSFSVLKNGGTPLEMEPVVTLEKADDFLLPLIMEAEEIWERYKQAAENILTTKILGKTDAMSEHPLYRWIEEIEEAGVTLLKVNDELRETVYYKNRKEVVN